MFDVHFQKKINWNYTENVSSLCRLLFKKEEFAALCNRIYDNSICPALPDITCQDQH